MKKIVWGLAACCLLLSAMSIQADEKRYRLELASLDGDLFGQPLAFQEVEPGPPAAPSPMPMVPPPGNLEPIPELPPGTALPPSAGFQTVELYHKVKIEDRDNIHPCAVKKIVAVKDPCAKDTACGTCAPPCVYVMICVPPDCDFEYDVKRKDHSKVEYDYGDYEVEITSKNGVIKVDYDD